MREYRARRRAKDYLSATADLSRELRRLIKSVKNNVALDLKSVDGTAWIVCPGGLSGGKNILASAKIIVLQGVMRVAT
jgi:hypothetical protein